MVGDKIVAVRWEQTIRNSRLTEAGLGAPYHNATNKSPPGPEAKGVQSTQFPRGPQSGDVIVPAATNSVRLVEEVPAIAQGGFRASVD